MMREQTLDAMQGSAVLSKLPKGQWATGMFQDRSDNFCISVIWPGAGRRHLLKENRASEASHKEGAVLRRSCSEN